MTWKLVCLFVVFTIAQHPLSAQSTTDIITETEASRIIRTLAGDSLKGRGNGRAELLMAGLFVGKEFAQAKLEPMPGQPGFFLPFRPFGGSKTVVSDELLWNGKKLATDAFKYIHPQPGNYLPKDLSHFTVIKIDSFFTVDILNRYPPGSQHLLLWSDQPQPDKENYFPPNIDIPKLNDSLSVLLVCATAPPVSVSLSGVANYYRNVEYNVIGLLAGKSKPDEYIIFSAHYDHEGVYQRGRRRDSILNGANDNASGVTALLLLARDLAAKGNNERSILFCAFAGEELGLLGSKHFVSGLQPGSVKAVINIEMIGIPQYGTNNIFITGPEHSGLPEILDRNLSGTGVNIVNGPSEEKELFKRSDNFPFVLMGIPAHSIMSSDDDDKCYHQPCDEWKRINISHLVNVTRALSTATGTLVAGSETPPAINPGQFKRD